MNEELFKKYSKYFYKIANIEAGQNISDMQKGGNILTITDGPRSFTVSGQNILDLELKLNLSPYGKVWSEIGNHLHGFYIYRGQINQPSSILYITADQWDAINSLNNSFSTSYYPTITNPIPLSNNSNNSITITDGRETLILQGTQINDLLSKLRLTIYGAKWPNIIATLYNVNNGIAPSQLLVTDEQFGILKNLYVRSGASLTSEFFNNAYGLVNSSDYSSPDVWDTPNQYKNGQVIFSDGMNVLTLKNEQIYKVYKKIKLTKYSKKFEYIRKKLHHYNGGKIDTIFVKPKELKFLSILKNRGEDFIKEKYGKKKN